jgi:hypothetical protein
MTKTSKPKTSKPKTSRPKASRPKASHAKRSAPAPSKPAYLNEKGRAAAYYFGAEYTANPGSSRMEYMNDCAFYYGKERYRDLSMEERNEIQNAFNEGCAAEKRNMVSFR